MAMSPKHRKFCEEYLRLWNATDAYQAAYPKSSREAARRDGSRLLTNADIAEEIQRRVAELTLSAPEVLVLLGQHARADIRDFIKVAPNGDVALDITAAKGKTHLIKKVTQRHSTRTTKDSVTEDTVLTLELHDAQAALVQLGKHYGIFDKRGSEETPIHNVDWTVDQWRAEQSKRREKASDTIDMFDDEDATQA